MEFLARTGSHRDLLSCGSPQRAERRAQLAREDLRLFPRGWNRRPCRPAASRSATPCPTPTSTSSPAR